MHYEHLRQWRDICEYLDNQWYKFVDDYCVENLGFTLLLRSAKPLREELWSNHMIQLCSWGEHPHSYHHHRSEYRKDYGWRVLPDWEIKIDFLEQIVLFDRNPDDIPQPWRKAIWERFFCRRERELEHERLVEEWRQRQQEELARFQQQREEKEPRLLEGECPSGFSCKYMTGSLMAGECPNFVMCKSMSRSI
jgi:hypothetical protein